MLINDRCEACLYNKQKIGAANIENPEPLLKKIREHLTKYRNMKSAPWLIFELNEMASEYGITQPEFEKEKKEYNQLLLNHEEKLVEKIEKSPDPLFESLMMAAKGNYIDFSALDNVNAEELMRILETKDTRWFEESYPKFKENIEKAKSIAYLCDNCGEIVLDKLFLKEIQKKNPQAQITVIVRGGPIFNDATLEDAKFCGLCEEFNVLPNGTAVAGTVPQLVSKEVKEALDKADVIISKGQGNFETFSQEGYDPYFLFLCKCEHFTDLFKVPSLTPVF